MAIQVRRGNEADFDASKMLPGEWAVSVDTKYVRMCFVPGLVLRMASYESFEADMELIQGILEECEEIQTAIERIKSEIDEKASLTIEYSNSASLSATRASEEADRAHEEAERAKNYADSAQSATNVQIATKDTAGIIKGGDNHIAEDGTLTLITETTETTMQNSCEGRLLFKEIRGKTEKATSKGSQLFDINNTELGSINSTTGVKEDTTSICRTKNPILVNPSTKYVLSYTSGSSALKVRVFQYNSAMNYIGTFIADSGVSFETNQNAKYLHMHMSGTSFPADTMLNIGTTALPWEPYENGIKSVLIRGIKTHGNNLFDTSVAVNGYITNDGEFSYHPYVIISDYIPSNGNVTVSLSKNVTAIAINCFDVDKGFVSKNVYQNCSVAKLEAVENCAYVRVAITAGDFDLDIAKLLTYEPMVNEGDIALPYEPYSGVTFSKPIKLNGIGDVQDVIVDGKPIRKFGVRIFNGSEIWTLATGQENSNTFHCEVPDAKRSKTTQNCLCDTYNFVDTDQRYLENNECTMYHDITDSYLGSNWIYIRDTTCTTNSEFKAKLQANPITVVYELATPITSLPTADQVALNSIETFDGTTHLEFDSPLQPEFVAEYGTSKVGGKTLEALAIARNNEIRISALETSVVNNI